MSPWIDHLEELISEAQHDVVLVAPFMKIGIIKRLFKITSSSVEVICVTRWRPEEVAQGVSDVEVMDACDSRPHTSLFLRHDLHAKYYRGDQNCLVGSANLTARALGLGSAPNFELLLELKHDHHGLDGFEENLFSEVVRATSIIRERVVEAAGLLEGNRPSPIRAAEESGLWGGGRHFGSWFPRCLVPQQLFAVYRADRSRLADPAYRDALEDLEILDPSRGLSADEFRAVIASRLVQHPIIGALVQDSQYKPLESERIGQFLHDYENRDPTFDEVDTIRKWIAVFFPQHASWRGTIGGQT